MESENPDGQEWLKGERMEEQRATLQEHQQALYTLLEEFDRVCKTLKIPYFLFAGTLLGAVRHKGFIPWDDDLDVVMLRSDYERFLKEADSVLDQERFFLQKEFTEHWPMFFSKLRLNGTTCLEKYCPKDLESHQGVYMDIFPCDNAAKTMLGKKLQFFASKLVIAKGLSARGYQAHSLKTRLGALVGRFVPYKLFLRIAIHGSAASPEVHTFFGAAAKFTPNVFPRSCFLDSLDAKFEKGLFKVPKHYHELLRIMYGDYMELPPESERKCKEHAILVDLHNSYEKYAHYRDGMKFEVNTRSIR